MGVLASFMAVCVGMAEDTYLEQTSEVLCLAMFEALSFTPKVW